MATTLTIERARKLLRIDRDDLSTELQRQATRFQTVAEQWALAVSEREMAKEYTKQVYAQVSGEIRTELGGESKRVTNAMVEERVENIDEYKGAREAYKQASRDAAVWETLKDAFRERGFNLRSLASLEAYVYNTPREAKEPTTRSTPKQRRITR